MRTLADELKSALVALTEGGSPERAEAALYVLRVARREVCSDLKSRPDVAASARRASGPCSNSRSIPRSALYFSLVEALFYAPERAICSAPSRRLYPRKPQMPWRSERRDHALPRSRPARRVGRGPSSL